MNEHDRLIPLAPINSPEHRFLAAIKAAESLRKDRIATFNRWSRRLTVAAILLVSLMVFAPALIALVRA